MLEAAKQSVATITPKASIKKTAIALLRDLHVQKWNDILDELTVQRDVILLEEEIKMWN